MADHIDYEKGRLAKMALNVVRKYMMGCGISENMIANKAEWKVEFTS